MLRSFFFFAQSYSFERQDSTLKIQKMSASSPRWLMFAVKLKKHDVQIKGKVGFRSLKWKKKDSFEFIFVLSIVLFS